MQTAPVNKTLEIVQKTTKIYEVQFKKNGANQDITGWTVFFTMKNKLTDEDVDAIISKTITVHEDSTQGKTLVELTSSDTDVPPKSYYFDIKFKDTSTPAQIGVVIQGRITITRISTQRES